MWMEAAYVSSGEAADLLGLSQERVKQLFDEGLLDGYKNSYNWRFIERESVLRLRGQRRKALEEKLAAMP